MKKILVCIISFVLLLTCMAGCKSKEEKALEKAEEAAREAQYRADIAEKEYNDLVKSLDHLDNLYDNIN